MSGWIKVIAATVFVTVIGRHIARVISRLDLGRHVYDHTPGPCRLVEGVEHGSEDMQALPDGTVLISSGMKSVLVKDNPVFSDRKGQIFVYNLKKRDKKATPLKITGGINQDRFEPHGISLWQDGKTGEVKVFVVNHGEEDDRVEKFHYDAKAKSLNHLESIRDPRMKYINDVAATSENNFYFTNFQYFTSYFGRLMEALLLLPYGSVGYYDGVSVRLVVEDLLAPNGIRVSADGKFVYMSQTGTNEILSYKRNYDNSLDIIQHFPVHTKPDNIELDASGDIWLGSVPVLWKAYQYGKDPSYPAPSQALHIRMKEGRAVGMTEVFADSGQQVYGSSVAVYYDGAMLVGTVYHKLLMCQVLHL